MAVTCPVGHVSSFPSPNPGEISKTTCIPSPRTPTRISKPPLRAPIVPDRSQPDNVPVACQT